MCALRFPAELGFLKAAREVDAFVIKDRALIEKPASSLEFFSAVSK